MKYKSILIIALSLSLGWASAQTQKGVAPGDRMKTAVYKNNKVATNAEKNRQSAPADRMKPITKASNTKEVTIKKERTNATASGTVK